MRETHQLRLSLPFSQRQILRPIDYFQISTLLFFSDIFSLLFQRKIEIFFFFAGYNLSEEAMAEKDTDSSNDVARLGELGTEALTRVPNPRVYSCGKCRTLVSRSDDILAETQECFGPALRLCFIVPRTYMRGQSKTGGY
ncbi:hypothetical protein C4D60_Mb03t11760 [Musa balbisiana]|uniref:Yippee domain-containing protein n=1 Tax=Musa balbisiana TaxID=52838 RepID=A0A4S8J9C2_MUSBA|nr:hypothetical protein C4D60_Mb03t11760 [Musa balbisiana]